MNDRNPVRPQLAGHLLLIGAIAASAVFARFAPSAPAASAIADATVRIDVRHASRAEWRALPGIGPTHARALANASAEGLLRSPEDILLVDGIGPKTLARLRPFLEPTR